MVRFAFTNIYINVTSNDNVNTILDGTLPVACMAGVRIDYWQERSMSVFDTPKEDTESLDYIFHNYIILTLSYFFGNIFCKNKIINTTRLLLSIFIIFQSSKSIVCQSPCQLQNLKHLLTLWGHKNSYSVSLGTDPP